MAKTQNYEGLGFPAYIARYWKPVSSMTKPCIFCGKHYYHIIAHTATCPEREGQLAEVTQEERYL